MIKKRVLEKLSILICILFISSTSFALDKVSYKCAVSFDINPQKIIAINNQNLTCSIVDQMKWHAYESFSKNSSAYIISNIDTSIEKIEKLERLLNDGSYAGEHTQLAIATFLKTVSALSLASCAPTAGGGCVLSAIGFVGGLYGQFYSVVDYDVKMKQLSVLKQRLKDAKTQLDRHKAQLPSGYNKAVKNFNKLCHIIKQQCVNK